MHRLLFPCLLLFSFFFFSACSEDISTPRAPGLQTPIVLGLPLTDASGNPIGEWGNPNRKTSGNVSGCNQKVEIHTYPIPASDYISMRIYSSCNQPINAWVTPARLADDLQTDVVSFGNAQLLKAGGQTIKVLAQAQQEVNLINWDGTDDTGKLVPSGFYRVYIQSGDLLLWENVLLFRGNVNNIPLSLLKMLGL